MYRIQLTNIAVEQIKKIETRAQKQILSKIESLKDDPQLHGKPLKGPLKEFRSIRAAGQRYRIIYKVQELNIVVIVIAVGIRKEGDKKDIYELMKKLVRTRILDEEKKS